jgi:hypothetical protein
LLFYFRCGKKDFANSFFLVIHVFIASWTALDKSPFLPPNRSPVFNLDCFSKSPEMSMLRRPNVSHLFTCFVMSKRPIFVFDFSVCHMLSPLIHIGT